MKINTFSIKEKKDEEGGEWRGEGGRVWGKEREIKLGEKTFRTNMTILYVWNSQAVNFLKEKIINL